MKCQFTSDNKFLPTGWLSPDGKFIECEYYNHFNKARHICEKYNYPDAQKELLADGSYTYADAEEILLNHGWVQISVSSFANQFEIYWNVYRRLNKIQREFLEPYMIINRTNIFHINRYRDELLELEE